MGQKKINADGCTGAADAKAYSTSRAYLKRGIKEAKHCYKLKMEEQYDWIMDFLTNRPQHVRSGSICSTAITLNTGVPLGCVQSPFLYSLLNPDCRPVNGSNSIILR